MKIIFIMLLVVVTLIVGIEMGGQSQYDIILDRALELEIKHCYTNQDIEHILFGFSQ
jgi:hypothetical protein